jgi:chromosome segregation ATPase
LRQHRLVEHGQTRHQIVTQSPGQESRGRIVAAKRQGRRGVGQERAMTQTDALQQALARFGASVETLENAFASLSEAQNSVARLKEQLRSLTDERNLLASERDRLALELDAERARAKRLEDANSEVSGRLEAVMGRLKDMTPAEGADY